MKLIKQNILCQLTWIYNWRLRTTLYNITMNTFWWYPFYIVPFIIQKRSLSSRITLVALISILSKWSMIVCLHACIQHASGGKTVSITVQVSAYIGRGGSKAERRTVVGGCQGFGPPAIVLKLGQFRSSHFTGVFRKRHSKLLVPSTPCLCQWK